MFSSMNCSFTLFVLKFIHADVDGIFTIVSFFFSYENALNVLVHELFHANELEFL